MRELTWILAHQGGWDEALYVARPAGSPLRVAQGRKRARANAEAKEAAQATSDQDTPGQ